MPSGSQMQSSQQAQRLKAFRELLDPADLLPGHNVADLYKLRHLCLQGGGLPEGTSTSSASTPASSSFAASRSSDAWLRAQAWRVLLGYLPPEKLEWKQVLNKRRGEYYQFVADFLPSSQDVGTQHGFPGKLSERDALLDQIYRDLSRSRKNAFSFYRAPVEPSRSCPLTPAPASAQGEQAAPRLEQRLSLLHRLASINADYADSLAHEALSRRPGTPSKASDTLHSHLSPPNMARTRSNGRGRAPAAKSPSIVLEPASPGTSEGPSEYFEEEDDSGFVSAEDNSHPSPPLAPSRDHHDGDRTSEDAIVDRRWHSLLRILYIYALLNPSIGYVQGMNEVLFVILYVMGTSSHLPSAAAASPAAASDAEQTEEEDATESLRYVEDSIDSPIAHAEADAFWCFSALIGEVRDLYDFDGVDHGTAGLRISNRGTSEEAPHLDDSGMAGALKRFSLRLKWLDEDLWRSMRIHSLDPRMPYYSFRWLACLISTELSLPSVVRVWDAILSETNEPTGIPGSSTAKVEFLIDVCCALLIHVRGQILDAIEEGEDDGDDQHDSFSRTMTVLQAYPDGDVGPILELASLYRQRRMASPLTGDGPPTEDDEEAILTMRQRAARAVRGWTATSTPSRPRWLSSPRQAPFESPSSSSAVSTPSRSPGAVLQRYADALQSSDAAASLSKASTNWTAKAMATWGERGNGERAGRDASPSPVNTDGSRTTLSLQSLFSKARSPSTSSTSAQSQASNSPSQSVHPALRWSRDGMPDLPIPNVEDSPVGSQEYGYGKRPISTLLGRAAGGTATGTGAGSSSPSNSTSGSPMNSPTLASSGRFGTLPSLQAGLRQTSKSSAGPKPLLLRTAARPPREGSNNGSAEPEEQSRIVSSGPLAARNGRRRRAAGASTERRGSGTASVTSSAMDGASESGGESNSVSAAPASVNATMPRSVAPASTSLPGDGDEAGADVTSSSGGGGRGTVPVSAFSKIRTSNNGDLSIDSDEVSLKPVFGQVASSADQPLNQKKPSLQRGIRRKDTLPHPPTARCRTRRGRGQTLSLSTHGPLQLRPSRKNRPSLPHRRSHPWVTCTAMSSRTSRQLPLCPPSRWPLALPAEAAS
ncbi:RabGAP/TBC [Acaromyces ingoldii]|uniref:RabGAP/TBC n=1 Tax=Acaromyces ingoldii TaxID=215250 RepID=A0A316YW04_9BASI|nr:RabGAP/TBC [Acaromyces ingoldii]PWN93312.1 RabGAP/TBC [Acaromyces ingoldii]